MFKFMLKRFSFFVFSMLLLASSAFGADSNKELTTDYITRLQNEISADISKLKEPIDSALAEIKLSSSDIKVRLAEIAELTEKSSDDMAAWGYTDEQRETHTQILSQLSVAYTAYEALLQNQISQNSNTPAEIDAA
ncbi:MAG: hypothetical protein IJ859_07565, partial [Synergistaceae bacterium]|nr:hypothetical protein [Synergistaceae bacterium]